jgi:hypothetical protein
MDIEKAAQTYEEMFQPCETMNELVKRFDQIDDQMWDYMCDNSILEEADAIEQMADEDLISAGERDACLDALVD